MPLAVIINGSTRSGVAEAFASALKEARPNTVVIGERSRGGGAEAQMQELPNCGLLSITTSHFATIRGQSLADGIAPDVTRSRRSETPGTLTPQLTRALSAVREEGGSDAVAGREEQHRQLAVSTPL